jgi:Integrase core domain
MNQPVIYIDPQKACDLDRDIILKKLFYRPEGYYRTAEKMRDACKKAGYNFSLIDIKNWLNKQALYQIHKPRPKFIPRASFNSIYIPNECHQADILYLPHDQVKNKIYKYCLCIVDVASRFKWAVPLTDRTASTIAKAFKKVYEDPKCFLTWPKLLMVDNGSEFHAECKELMKQHNVKIKIGTSHRSQAIVERFNRTLAERLFRLQDASDLLLPINERSRTWVKNLSIIIKDLNNSVTRLINMTPNEAIKKKKVIALPSLSRNGPVGFDESKLSYNVSVRYLLESGELEGGSKRATDCNWSPQIYFIKESLVQKNQPVLYWLENENGDGPKRSFVREELQIVKDVQLPPKWVLK